MAGGAAEPSTSAPTSSAPASAAFPGKDCRACAGATHLLEAFTRFSTREPSKAPAGQRSASTASTALSASSSSGNSSHAGQPAATPASVAAASATAAAAAAASSSSAQAEQQQQQALLPCPPDTAQLGKAAWTFLHTTAAYYPDQPSAAQQSLMRSMMDALAEFYPCHICADHLRDQFKASPPQVGAERQDGNGKLTATCGEEVERWGSWERLGGNRG